MLPMRKSNPECLSAVHSVALLLTACRDPGQGLQRRLSDHQFRKGDE